MKESIIQVNSDQQDVHTILQRLHEQLILLTTCDDMKPLKKESAIFVCLTLMEEKLGNVIKTLCSITSQTGINLDGSVFLLTKVKALLSALLLARHSKLLDNKAVLVKAHIVVMAQQLSDAMRCLLDELDEITVLISKITVDPIQALIELLNEISDKEVLKHPSLLEDCKSLANHYVRMGEKLRWSIECSPVTD